VRVLPYCSPQINRYRTPRDPSVGSTARIYATVLVPPPPRDGSVHMPVGSGSLQVPAMIAPAPCGSWSASMPVQTLNSKDKSTLAATAISETQSTGCSSASLGGLLVNTTTTVATSGSTLVRRNLHSNSDLPDPESLDAQRRMCLEEINETLIKRKESLREANAAQKKALQRQAEHVKRAYVSKIDHEVMVEEANLDRQANYEHLQLQHAAAHCKAMLEQQACAAVYEIENQKRQEALREEICSVLNVEQCQEAILAQPPMPRPSLISAHITDSSFPHALVPVMAPSRMQPTSTVSDTTTLAASASPLATPTSSFVPWPIGSCDPTMLSWSPPLVSPP